jgi:hypothetical protein
MLACRLQLKYMVSTKSNTFEMKHTRAISFLQLEAENYTVNHLHADGFISRYNLHIHSNWERNDSLMYMKEDTVRIQQGDWTVSFWLWSVSAQQCKHEKLILHCFSGKDQTKKTKISNPTLIPQQSSGTYPKTCAALPKLRQSGVESGAIRYKSIGSNHAVKELRNMIGHNTNIHPRL